MERATGHTAADPVQRHLATFERLRVHECLIEQMAAIALLDLFLYSDQPMPTAAVLDVGPRRDPLLHRGAVRGHGLGVRRTAFDLVRRSTRHRMRGDRQG